MTGIDWHVVNGLLLTLGLAVGFTAVCVVFAFGVARAMGWKP
jgi:hypothetical protein